MADFLTTHATTAGIEELISRAQERIVLISPYLKWSRILFERLLEADRRGVQVVFIYGKKELAPEQRRRLDELTHLSLYFCENLHAKCYFNEKQLIISSLNLLEFSERNNREMSVRVLPAERAYKDAVIEANSIIEASRLERGDSVELVRSRSSAKAMAKVGIVSDGFCIRCKKVVPADKERPFCYDCFLNWASWENWDYAEKYCHLCGAEVESSRRRPLCDRCLPRKS
jgi:phosphatidylserine/phosphatidylglycerophosphate/cardiolipin synthase-like enzyme